MTLLGDFEVPVSFIERMTWNRTDEVTERMKFVASVLKGDATMVEVCARFGISRKTGYKFLNRYQEFGPEGLRGRGSAPLTHPNQTPASVEAAILKVRKVHPTWGSRKILTTLVREAPELDLPARSTVDAILKRAGVVTPRLKGRQHRRKGSVPPVVDANAPNDAWSIDFKGWFLVGDGTRCDPLTVNDVATRTSLECRAMVGPRLKDVKKRLESVFDRYGLPRKMLSDNGKPFGSNGLAGLTQLGVWLIRLGIEPVFIQPGRPDQNGRHERFHSTLNAEAIMPPKELDSSAAGRV